MEPEPSASRRRLSGPADSGGATHAAAAPAASISCLPDDCLALVLEQAGLECGAAITLACRRWNRLFYSSKQLWRSFEVGREPARDDPLPRMTEQKLAAKRRQLQRVAPLVESFRARGLDSADLEALTCCLSPAALVSYSAALSSVTEATLQHLRSLTRLSALNFKPWLGNLPAGTSQALSQLTTLRVLALWVARAGPYMVPLAALQRLKSLELISALEPLPPLGPLSALSSLVVLVAAELVAAPTGLALLPDDALRSRRKASYASPLLLLNGATATPGPVHRAARITVFDDDGSITLVNLRLQGDVGAAIRTLAGQRCAITALCACHCLLEPANWRPCAELAAVHALTLEECREPSRADFQPVLAAALQQMPRLQQLQVAKCNRGSGLLGLPASLSGLTALRSLHVTKCQIHIGPLTALEELVLDGNNLYGLPTLPLLPRLTHLSLRDNESLLAAGDDADLERLLSGLVASLPSLRRLDLGLAPIVRLVRRRPDLDIA